MTEHARRADQQRTSFLAALRHRLWERPRREREVERRRLEEQRRAERRLPNLLLWVTLRPVLLALLEPGEQHGYGIVRKLEEAGLPPAREALIYPALRKLETDGLVESYVVPQDEGKPARKYYRILPAGAAALEESWREWRSTVGAIDALRQRGGDR